jgi:ABC-type transporter Mla MlaB component
MKIICHTYQDRPMLSVCGPLTIEHLADLEKAIDDIRCRPCDGYYLDLSGVGLLDEATCQLLTRLNGQLDGKPIELTFVTPHVLKQIKEAGLDKIYPITPERRRWTRGLLSTWQRLAFLERRHELYDDHPEFARRTLIWCGVGLACLSLIFVLLIGRLSGVLQGRTTTPNDSPSLETVVKQKHLR